MPTWTFTVTYISADGRETHYHGEDHTERLRALAEAEIAASDMEAKDIAVLGIRITRGPRAQPTEEAREDRQFKTRGY